MFTVKATYHGEIRKFTFPDNSFPSFDQLCNQLYRFFPSSSNCYLSMLLFSPDASQSSRILIGQEIHTAEDYERCIQQHNNRTWTNALLRFSVLDVNQHKTPCTVSETRPAQPLVSNWSTQGSTGLPFIGAGGAQSPLRPISLSHIPPPPVLFTPPRAFAQDPASVETAPVNHYNNPFLLPFPQSQHAPAQPTTDTRSMTSCCSIAQGKTEVRDLISDFQRKLDDILTKTFGSQPKSNSQNTQPNSTVPPTPPIKPWFCPVLCVSCQNDVTELRQFTCENCRTILCFECYMSGKSGFCMSSMGSHFIKEITRNSRSLAPSVPYQWPSSILHPTPAWMQPMPPAVLHPSDPYVTPVQPFIPPLPFGSDNPFWSPVQPPILHPPPSTVIPHPPSPGPILITTPPPRPPIHRGVLCDRCDKVIEGVRHKCLDCPDYDLCTSCISTGSAERHNPFHEFFEITEPGRVVVHTIDRPHRGPAYDTNHASAPAPAPAPATDQVVHAARCNLCDSRIQGCRYKCATCPDFDTCSSCFSITQEQHPGHSFVKLSNVDDYIQRDSTHLHHHNATCDACNNPIIGVRFKCMHPDCPDFDLCEGCEAHPIAVHPDRHPLLKIKSVGTVIPKFHINHERSSSLLASTPQRAADYENRNIYNSSEFVPISQLNPPSPDFGWKHSIYNPYAGQSFSPLGIPMNPTGYSDPDHPASPSVNHGSPFIPPTNDTVVASAFVQSWARNSVELFDPPSRPVTPAWKPISEPTYVSPMNNRTMSAQEAARSPLDTMSRGAWVPSSHELDHLIQEQPAAPKPFYEEGQQVVNGNNIHTPSDGDTPFQSPLGYEALLNRPASVNVPEPSELVMVSSANRSLAALLDDYRSATSQGSSSVATSVDEREAPSDAEVQQELAADFVADITVPDGQNFPPGAEFVKCWRMMNDGERDWPEATELVFLGGTPLLKEGSPSSMKVGVVKAGSEVDLWTGELKAPDAPGRHIGFWRLRDDQGQLFGHAMWVVISVIEATRDPSDQSLASSSIIMPNVPPSHSTSPTRSHAAAGSSVTMFSKLRSQSDALSADDMSDTSSISLVSALFSEDEDAQLWEASRGHDASVESAAQNMEYVLLYDDNTSEEE